MCPVIAEEVEDCIENESQRKISELNKLNDDFNKLQDEQQRLRDIENQPVININVMNKKRKNKLCELVKSGSVVLVDDSEGSELKDEFDKFSFEFNRKTKSKEDKLPKKLRNGW
jgi:Skp family chaperone for outer membrane proteins